MGKNFLPIQTKSVKSPIPPFLLSKSVCKTFLLKSPINPSKVKWSTSKIHQTFGQLTDSDFIISKGIWNNRGQNSLKERGWIRFYLPLPREFIWTYGDVITKFSWMDSLPNFITHGGSAMKQYIMGYMTFPHWGSHLSLCISQFQLRPANHPPFPGLTPGH